MILLILPLSPPPTSISHVHVPYTPLYLTYTPVPEAPDRHPEGPVGACQGLRHVIVSGGSAVDAGCSPQTISVSPQTGSGRADAGAAPPTDTHGT